MKATTKNLLDKARQSALQAVGVYNAPGNPFRSGNYIVLMMIAWTSALLAYFIQNGTKPYYRKNKAGHFERIDGEPKAWDLARLVKEYWKNRNYAVPKNLEMFIGLRNKIEHRIMPALDPHIFGECQAMLLNFEEFLTTNFGEEYAINESLAFSLQFSTQHTPKQLEALTERLKREANDIVRFLERYRGTLSDDVYGDQRYSFQLFLVPRVKNNRTRDSVAIEFVKLDPDDQGKEDALKVLTKDRQVPVFNVDHYKPSDVVNEVAPAVKPRRFSMHQHTQAWKYYEVRPGGNASKPTDCKTEYCRYDAVHGDYVYTRKWIEFLKEQIQDENEYRAITQTPV